MPEIFKEPYSEETGISQEKLEQEIKEINFADLEIGDKLIIETSLEKEIEKFEITVIGKRKDGLLVSVKGERGQEQPEEFLARMPGGFTMHQEEGLTPGILKAETEAEKNCLYFENLKNPETQEKISSSRRTTPVKRIVFIKKERRA